MSEQLANKIKAVRLYISRAANATDLAESTDAEWYDQVAYFSDDDLSIILYENNGSVKRAAADALRIMAQQIVIVGKDYKQDDLSVFGSRVALALNRIAEGLIKDAKDAEEDGSAGTVIIKAFGFKVGSSRYTRVNELTEMGRNRG